MRDSQSKGLLPSQSRKEGNLQESIKTFTPWQVSFQAQTKSQHSLANQRKKGTENRCFIITTAATKALERNTESCICKHNRSMLLVVLNKDFISKNISLHLIFAVCQHSLNIAVIGNLNNEKIIVQGEVIQQEPFPSTSSV